MSRPYSAVQTAGQHSAYNIRRTASNPQLYEERKPLKVLNLGIQFTPSLSNGVRPHGGHRGTRGSPPSRYSVNKDSDYHHRLKLMKESEFASPPSPPPSTPARPSTSPAWALRVVREHSKAAESPLFTKGLLSPKATDTQPVKHTRGFSPSTKRQYYRPNTAHEYLPASGNGNKENDHLGRPTRTTLLRAEQRCNSAPINSYRYRREIMKQFQPDNKSSATRPIRGNCTPTFNTSDGESMHAFLIGARYNRAHFVDFKSFSHHGVYMPRDNPQSCFVHRPKSAFSLRTEKRSEAPPSTPCEISTPNLQPSTPPTPSPPSPVPLHRENGISPPPSTPRFDEEQKTKNLNSTGEKLTRSESAPAKSPEPLDNLIVMNKGLNVIGRPFKGTTATNIVIPGSQPFLEESAVPEIISVRQNAHLVRQSSKNESPRLKNIELDALQVVGISKSPINIPTTAQNIEPETNTARAQNRFDINPSKSSKSENVSFFVTETTDENPEKVKSTLAIEGVVVQSRPKKQTVGLAQSSQELKEGYEKEDEKVPPFNGEQERREENDRVDEPRQNGLDAYRKDRMTFPEEEEEENTPSVQGQIESADDEIEAEVISVRISHKDNPTF